MVARPFLSAFFISNELREIKSLRGRVVVQQIKTNVSAFCSRSQQSLTCRSHYITHWKWPEMHVRLNQLAAQPLVQLRSWVGVVSGGDQWGWSVWFAVWWVQAPRGAVSAEISSAAPAICHYLMVNPSVSWRGPCQDRLLNGQTEKKK